MRHLPLPILILMSLLLCGNPARSQEEKESNRIGFDLTIGLLAGLPQGQFAREYPSSSLWGLNIEATVSPFGKHHWWKTGVQLEGYNTGTKKDDWQGVELTTESSIAKVNFLNRVRLAHSGIVDPFLEFGIGLNISTTTSGYLIYDEATFLEQLFFNKEGGYSREEVKSFSNVTSNIGFGFGVMVKRLLVMKVKYDRSPQIEFVPKNGIAVVNDQILYESKKSKMQIISLSLGFSLEKLFDKPWK